MSEPATTKAIVIDASPSQVWRALTTVDLMPKWMSETEMEVETDWQVGHSIIIHGRWHKMRFRNAGKVLRFDPGHTLSYSHLSSLSRLPDQPENYSVITFKLNSREKQTSVELTLSNSPTDVIQKHLDLYWNVTLVILKEFVEQQLRG